MTTIEILAIIILAIIVLPFICQLVKRPGLLYSSYLIFGVLLGTSFSLSTAHMMEEIGKIGFILLLFLIGLEIEIPSFAMIKRALPFCVFWFAVQIPLVAFIAWHVGLDLDSAIVAATAINACSLSISYPLLKSQTESIDHDTRKRILVEMVILEVVSLFILAASDVVYTFGWGKEVLFHSALLVGFIIVIKMSSGFIHRHMSIFLDNVGHWRIHQLLLIVFIVAIVGERIGLSGPKTAFFLGLFMTALTHRGLRFEDELMPIAQGVLIPIFFIQLGSRISIYNTSSIALLTAISITLIVFMVRFILFMKRLSIGIKAKYFLLYCPNLTMVAVAAEILTRHQTSHYQVELLLATGLLMTVIPSLLFPVPTKLHH